MYWRVPAGHGRGFAPAVFLRSPWLRLVAIVAFLAWPSIIGVSLEVVVFGPQTYLRGTGEPVTVTKTFRIDSITNPFRLRVTNHGVTSAVISMNGREVFGPGDFTGQEKDGTVLERPVSLSAGDNTIAVELRSTPGTSLSVQIFAVLAPTVRALEPAQLTVAASGGLGGLTVSVQNPDPLQDTHIALTSSDPTVAAVAAEVVLPAGTTTGLIVVTGGNAGGPVPVTASLNGTSATSEITVLDRPAPPTLAVPLVDGMTIVGGVGVADALVNVQVNGGAAGAGSVGADGHFAIPVAPLIAGQVVRATQTISGLTSLNSAPVIVQARPPAPTVNSPLIEGGTQVAGTSASSALVDVFVNGAHLATGLAGVDGTFTIAVPVLVAGQQVTATQTVAGVTSIQSAAVTVVAAPAPPSITSPLIAGATSITGTGSSGATVEAFVEGGSVGAAIANGSGTWTLAVDSALVAGQHVKARQTVGGIPSAFSAEVIVVARPPAPVINTPLVDGSTSVGGTGVAGASVAVFINAGAAGSTAVGGDGTWTLTLNDPLVVGQIVIATETVGGIESNSSPPTTVVARPPAPMVNGPLVAGATSVTGAGVGGAAVALFVGNGAAGSGTVNPAGVWTILLANPLVVGQQVTANQTVAGVTSDFSTPVTVVAQPPAPSVSGPLFAGGMIVSGTGLAAASLEVFANGASLGSTAVTGGGTWSLPLTTALIAGQVITAQQTVGGIASALSAPVIVQAALTQITITPSPTATITKGQTLQFLARGMFSDGSIQDPLSGVTWISDHVAVVSVAVDGLATGASAGVANIHATNGTVSSSSTALTVKPLPPTVSSPLYAGATAVSGTSAEPSAAVHVFVNGVLRGAAAFANASGQWSVLNLSPAVLAGDLITAAQTVNGVTSDLSLPVAANPGVCVPPPAGLIGWWPGDGNPNDIVGTHNGTLQGGVTFVPGMVGQAFSFDGAAGVVSIPAVADLDIHSAVTIDAWIKPTKFGNLVPGTCAPYAAGCGVIAGRPFGYQLTILPDGRLRLGFPRAPDGPVEAILDSNDVVSTENFTFVAATYDSSTGVAAIYINGVLDSTTITSGLISSPTKPFQIGGFSDPSLPSGYGAFTGIIDELELSPRALSGAEILAMFNAGAAGKCKNSNLPSCVAPPSGLVGWWPANGSGADLIGGHDGTLIGTVTFAPGEVSEAFNFSASVHAPGPIPAPEASYVEVPGSSALDMPGPFTIEAWVRFNSLANQQYLVIKDSESNEGKFHNYQLFVIGDTPYPNEIGATGHAVGFMVGDGTTLYQLYSHTTLSAGVWYHITAVYDGNNQIIYVNGQQDAIQPIGARTLFITPTKPMRLGIVRELGDYWYPLNGQLDEVSLYNRALSTDEVQAIHAAGASGKCIVPASPTLLSVNPSTGQQGQQNLPVVVTGQFTHFAQGATTASFGAGITVTLLTVNSPTSAAAVLSMDPAAQIGSRVVTLTTGSEVVTLLNGFTVTAALNLPPVVSAGSNQSIALPDSATLHGVVTDDGLPLGILTAAWSKVSGPGTVAFSRPADPVTTVSFSANGTYVLRLQATDGALSASSEVTITVDPCLTSKEPGIRLAGVAPGDFIQLADGRLRMYEGTYDNVSTVKLVGYVSSDGMSWAPEAGISFTPTGDVKAVAWVRVIRLTDSSYRMYFLGNYSTSGPGFLWRIYSAVSPDGLTWTQEPGIRVDIGGPNGCVNLGAPDIMRLSDGSLRMYYSCSRALATTGGIILSATSADGLTWVAEPGVRLTPTAVFTGGLDFPQVLSLPDGSYRMYYSAFIISSPAYIGQELSATSSDLPNWTPEPGIRLALGPSGSLDDSDAAFLRFVPLPDFTFRAYYHGFGHGQSIGMLSARWCSIGTNNPPSVNAGGDQTVPLATGVVSLAATATDDGLPVGGALSYQWSAVSGPASVTFASPSAASTAAQFVTPGGYVFRVIVGDGQLFTADEVNVTVTSPTAPSIVSVSPSAAVQGASLSVTVTGQNTHFVQGISSISVGADLTVNSVTVSNSTTLVAQISVAPNAATGQRVVTVTTGGETVVWGGFTINVLNPTLPPTVDPGHALSTVLLSPTALTGTITGTGPVVVTWSKVSGPGSVVFTDANAPATTAMFDRLGAYVLRLSATNPAGSASGDLSVTVGCPAGPYPVGEISFCDDFNRADGLVDNGWSTWWGPTLDAPQTGLLGGQLRTLGYIGQAGGIYQTAPITFPASFSFDFRTEATRFLCGSSSFNDGGWILGFNLPPSSVPANYGGFGPAQLYLVHYSGQRNVTRGYWDGSHMVFEQVFDGPVGALRDYQAGTFARIDGNINADLSTTVVIHYNDGQTPDPVSVTLPPLPGAANVPLGNQFELSNANCTSGPHFFDNLAIVASGASIPNITSISPNTAQQGQQNLSVNLTGQFTHWAQGTAAASFGAGITVAALTVNSTTTATAVLNIEPAAATGTRTVTVTTGAEVASLSDGFTVTAGTPPVITQVNPNTGPQGQGGPVSIVGQNTHFIQGSTQLDMGAGITISSITVSCSTCLSAQVSIADGAPTGPRNVTVTTGTEVVTLSGGFTVQPGTPILTSLSRASGQQDQSFPVTITGKFTHFAQGTTQVDLGPGIVVSAVTVTSATSLSGQVAIDATAALGPRTLTVTTGSEVVFVNNVFTVLAPATLTRIDLTPAGTVTLTKGQSVQFSARGTFSDNSVQDPLPGVTWNSDVPAVASIAASGLATGVAAGIAHVSATKSGIQSATTDFVVKPMPVGIFGPIGAGSTVVDGAVAEPGASVQVFVNGLPRGPTAVADSGGFWTVSGLAPALVVGDSVTARQTVNGVTSDSSGAIIVTAGTPTLLSVNPATGTQGQQNLNVVITGQFTHFTQGVTTVLFASNTITVNSVTASSLTSLTANISIALNASLVPRTVTVTTGAEVVALANAFTVQLAANQAPTITIAPAWMVTLPNRLTLAYSVTDDGLPLGGALTVTWEKISGPGTVGFQNQTPTSISVGFDLAGTYVLRIAATDTQLTVHQDVTVTVTGVVTQPPAVSIASPTEGSEVTSPINVIGSVASPTLASWTLEFRMKTESTFRPLATGTTAVTNGVLGSLDPTLLLNGIALIQLRATDIGGQTSIAGPVSVVVTQNQKVGNFTVSFNDLTVPVAGLPIQVVRTYDSRNKAVGDFGVGWKLDLSSVSVATNGALGDHWTGTVSGEFFPNYCIQATTPHVVTISFSDGTVFQFQPTLNPDCQQLVPLSQTTVGFAPISTTPPSVSLAVVGNNQPFVSGGPTGPIELLDLDEATIFDPDLFQLTMPDGRVLLISQQSGLKRMTDPNGNTLTITAGGITHSSGKSVIFQRDASQRITQITDPAGNAILYAYDGNGDLVSVTDRSINTTTFTYNTTHGLLTIVDPRGVQPIKNVYDDSGRLIQHIDAFGKTIDYTHNLNTRQEVVTDRLGNVTVNEYDTHGNVVLVTDALAGQTTRTYDGRNNLLTETNPLGKTRTYTYDANNNRLTERDALGNTTQYTYNSGNQVLTITDALGRVTTNTYDAQANLTATIDALGKTTTYTYDARGLRTAMTDPLGNVTAYEYDASGNLTKQTDGLGHVTTSTYDANGNRLTESKTQTTAGGPQTVLTQYQYDAQNRLTQTTFADGGTTRTVYNSIGKPATTIDQLGRHTAYEYDLMGRLTKTTFPDTTMESATYDAEGDRITSVDRGNRTTSYAYDALKRLVQTTFADNATAGTIYDAGGEVTAVTDGRGNVTHYAYDDAGRRASVTDALTHVTTFAYDAVGNQSSMKDANGNVTQYEYDNAYRRLKTIYPDTTSDSVVYDAMGRTVSKTDQAGKTTQFQFDKLGGLTAVIDALSQTTSYTYDELGNRTSQTDANGHVTQFAYDALGRRVGRTLPLGMSETSTYNMAGSLAAKTDFNGKTTTYAYDLLNRLTSKTPDPTLGQPTVQFSYSETGQRAQMIDASGTTTYTYDLRDRLVSKATPQGTLTYTYDQAGDVASIRSSNAGGTSVNYTYDALNRLATVTDNRLESGVATYAYDNAGNLANFAYPNGVKHTYAYNALNRLTSLAVADQTSSTLASYGYTLGPTGNRVSVAEFGGRQVDYTYDSLYRLTVETITGGIGGTTTYAYDHVGNRLSLSSPTNGLTMYTYDANDRLSTDTYDNDGNTIASGVNQFNYDFENHLTSENGGALSIVYDGDGNRVAKTIGGVTTQYLVDDRNLTGYAQVLEELSGGAVQRVYTYGLNRISQRQASGTSFYGYDGHGNVRILTDTAGGVTDRYDYDGFGNIISQAGSTPNAYLFAGEQFDSGLELTYLRARYLQNRTGRFWSRDSFDERPSDPSSLHKYVYVRNNPINLTDPSGLFTREFGYAVELEVDLQYEASHFLEAAFISDGKSLGTTIGRFVDIIYGALKPDILNYSGFPGAMGPLGRLTWLEIKPLSIPGVAAGVAKMALDCAYLCEFGFSNEYGWTIPEPFVTVQGTPLTLMNVGGIIFYTDLQPDAQDSRERIASTKDIEEARRLARKSQQQRISVDRLGGFFDMFNFARPIQYGLPSYGTAFGGYIY